MSLHGARAVFFDLYNTLARFWPPREELQAKACRALGLSVTPQGIAGGYAVADAFMAAENARLPLRQRDPQDVHAFFAEYERLILVGAGVDTDLLLAAQVWEQVRLLPYDLTLFDDVVPSLGHLRSVGLILGLISNINRNGEELCQSLGLGTAIDFVVTSQEVQAEKPHPPIFLAALERGAVEPSLAVHVGDQYISDILGARNVGIHPVMMDRYWQSQEKPDYPVVHSMPDLEKLFIP